MAALSLSLSLSLSTVAAPSPRPIARGLATPLTYREIVRPFSHPRENRATKLTPHCPYTEDRLGKALG